MGRARSSLGFPHCWHLPSRCRFNCHRLWRDIWSRRFIAADHTCASRCRRSPSCHTPRTSTSEGKAATRARSALRSHARTPRRTPDTTDRAPSWWFRCTCAGNSRAGSAEHAGLDAFSRQAVAQDATHHDAFGLLGGNADPFLLSHGDDRELRHPGAGVRQGDVDAPLVGTLRNDVCPSHKPRAVRAALPKNSSQVKSESARASDDPCSAPITHD